MKDLLIGFTSQLAKFWSKDNAEIISSRNIDIDWIKSKQWNRIYLTFAEQRTFLNDYDLFYDVNVSYTQKIIKNLQYCCEKIVVYSTSELWNLYDGAITLKMPFNGDWNNSNYILSKLKMTEILGEERKRGNLENLIILYPFNFNSIYRGKNFLFGKVFDSIILKNKISIGDTYSYREILHPKFVVRESINSKEDKIIGSGRMLFVNDLIRELYDAFEMKYEDYVKEDKQKNLTVNRSMYYLETNNNACLYTKNELLFDLIYDIKSIIV